jgi:hypothetical protein
LILSFVTYRLKARSADRKEMAITREQPWQRIHATIEEMLEAVFSMGLRQGYRTGTKTGKTAAVSQ